MSKPRNDRLQRRQKEPHADNGTPKQPGPTQDTPYEVGYRKPPGRTRFAKGQSGNPHGRPRKSKPRETRLSDAPSDRYFEQEAYRVIPLQENGKSIELPISQAVLRSLAMSAIKGNRLAQKYWIEKLERMEDDGLKRKVERYVRLEALKYQGKKILAEHERQNLPPPELFPHPDDIVLKPETGEAFVHGPETKEELPRYEGAIATRNYYLLLSAHAEKIGRGPKLKHGDKEVCAWGVFAHLIDSKLPRSLRWPPWGAASDMFGYHSLSRRERERRIENERSRLDEFYPEPLDPELEEEIAEILRKKKMTD